MASLILGPMARWASTSEATVWVETDERCEVEVHPETGETASARTFTVEGHHYAIVRVSGLPEDRATPYRVTLNGEPVWPEPDSPFPPSTLRTHSKSGKARIVFGSCRTAYPHHPPYSLTADESDVGREVDSLRAIALRMTETDPHEWPHSVLLLGDQVYADEVSPQTLAYIRRLLFCR
jgi:hypothetical protein